MTLSFNSATIERESVKIREQNKAATVLVTPRGMTPHLIGDAMRSDSTSTNRPTVGFRKDLTPRVCIECCAIFFVRRSEVPRGRGVLCSVTCQARHKSGDPAARFWANIDYSDPNGCWIWTGNKDKGYGKICVPIKKRAYAHRFSFELHKGKIPEGMLVLHSCPNGNDNPSCVNPDHLRVGTQKDNLQDRLERGRAPLGEQSHVAKLKATQVIEIRNLYSQGSSIAGMSRAYGMSESAISAICTGKSWRLPFYGQASTSDALLPTDQSGAE